MWGRGDIMGRRRALILASLFYLVGAGVISMSGLNWLYCLGRGVFGFGVGASLYSSPIYIAEMSPKAIRGLLISLKQAFVALGVVCSYVTVLGLGGEGVDGADPGGSVPRRKVYAIAFVPALLQLIGMALLDPTPRWTVLRGKQDYAMKANKTLHRVAATQAEIEQFSAEMLRGALQEEEAPSLAQLLAHPHMRGVVLPVMLAEQLCGIPALQVFIPSLLYYLEKEYDMGTISLTHKPLILICSGLVLGANLTAAFLVDSSGRRPLLKAGGTIQAVSLGVVGLSMIGLRYAGHREVWDEWEGWECALVGLMGAGLVTSIVAFNLSFAPLSWLISTELFSLHWRGRVLALCVMTQALAQAVVLFGLQMINPHSGTLSGGAWEWTGTSALLALLTAVSLWWILRHLPETRGPVSYTHLRAHETPEHLVCRLLLEKKKNPESEKN
eukprot:TRINITY_DN24640_c0_g1_i3.p1 TRINITY_DN24640_c0_g1~~TRINITY_DN24640_c0_g1_i3.p1  ORF type:complete len:442 (+),score=99.07 TRINITY_DN24640_c0_g1_i3:179-1504(+)